MDLRDTIRALYEEKKRLEGAIAELERQLGEVTGTDAPTERRGRKSMSPEERLQVSRRMRKYWASRRRMSKEDG